MAVFKFLFYLAIYFLIRIGDIVVFLLLLPYRALRIIGSYLKNHVANFKSYSSHIPVLKVPKVKFPKFQKTRFSFKIKKKNFKQKKTEKRERKLTDNALGYRTGFFSKLKYFIFGILFSATFIFFPLIFYIFISDLPTLDGLSVSYIPKTTKILDRNGELLYEIYANQNRTIIRFSEVPLYFQQATMAIEDQDFYNHPGFDIRGIARAIYLNFTKGEFQGGSTITQQLIKSALLTPEPTIMRKVKEIALAFWAEQKYSKKEILELYFNYVPYGGTAWGAEAASEVYFGKKVSEIDLSEAAFLAGLPKAPTRYSPYINTDNAWKRRQWDVLEAMVRDGYITEIEAHKAYSKTLAFKNPQTSIRAPHFVMYVKNELIKRYGLYEVERGGLQVKTTLDLRLQKFAEEQVKKTVFDNQYLGIGNAASVVTYPAGGDILAMVGSKDFFDSSSDGNFNLTTALRQPGSTIKIVTYAAALSTGFTEGSILMDAPVTIKIPGSESYKPVNYDGAYHGPVPLRIAFANSYNIPAVRVAEKLGPEKIAEYGRKMGISSWSIDKPYGLSITLGGNEVTMLDLSTAYGTVANGGKRVSIDPILEVRDSGGRLLDEKIPHIEQVIDEGVAFIIEDILSDNLARSRAFGVNSPLNIPGQRIAVKTGTTDNKRDNWTIGFNENYLVATWVGNNDNTPLSPTLSSGITGAAPLWRTIMENLVQNEMVSDEVNIPENIVSKSCFGYTAYFLRGTEDTFPCRLPKPSPTPDEK